MLCTRNAVTGALVLTTGREFVVQLLVLPPAGFCGVKLGSTVFPSTLGSFTPGRVTGSLLVLNAPDVVIARIQEFVVTGFSDVTAAIDGVIV